MQRFHILQCLAGTENDARQRIIRNRYGKTRCIAEHIIKVGE